MSTRVGEKDLNQPTNGRIVGFNVVPNDENSELSSKVNSAAKKRLKEQKPSGLTQTYDDLNQAISQMELLLNIPSQTVKTSPNEALSWESSCGDSYCEDYYEDYYEDSFSAVSAKDSNPNSSKIEPESTNGNLVDNLLPKTPDPWTTVPVHPAFSCLKSSEKNDISNQSVPVPMPVKSPISKELASPELPLEGSSVPFGFFPGDEELFAEIKPS